MATVTTVQYQPPPPPQVAAMMVAAAPSAQRPVPSFRDRPVACTCPNCQANVVSEMTYVIGTYTIVLSMVLIFFGLVFGCCIIPFLLDMCKDVNHHCPHCRSHLGTYRKM